jgi:hypothetical protein
MLNIKLGTKLYLVVIALLLITTTIGIIGVIGIKKYQ